MKKKAVLRIRDPVPFWPLDPGSEIGFFRIPDLGSRIPNPYFWELRDNFLGKKFYNSLKIGPNIFLQHFKNKKGQFCEIYDSKKKVWQQIFFHQCLSLLFLDPESGMGKNQDPVSGINIPDPPHWKKLEIFLAPMVGSCFPEPGGPKWTLWVKFQLLFKLRIFCNFKT